MERERSLTRSAKSKSFVVRKNKPFNFASNAKEIACWLSKLKSKVKSKPRSSNSKTKPKSSSGNRKTKRDVRKKK